MKKLEYASPKVEIAEITVQCGMLIGSGNDGSWTPEDGFIPGD